MLLERNDSVLLIVDMQERFASAIQDFDGAVYRIGQLARAAALMNIPVLVSEQYPKGLGHTVEPIRMVLPVGTPVFEKAAFSCFDDDAIRKNLLGAGRKSLIVTGIESHICILQTALAAAEAGFKVCVPSDAVSSRNGTDKEASLQNLTAAGISTISTEALIFMLLKTSRDPVFKDIQKIIVGKKD